jgi:hypothetical protein
MKKEKNKRNQSSSLGNRRERAKAEERRVRRVREN